MLPGAAALEMTDSLRLGRLAYVEDEKAFGGWLAVGAAPAPRDAFEAGEQFSFGDLGLDRPGIFRSGNERAIFRRRGVGDVEHTPATMPEVGDVEIPATVHFLHRQFKCRLAV